MLDYRYTLQPANNNDLLSPYKELIINSHQNQQDILHLIDEMKQWSIPKFPINAWDLQQNGLMSHGYFSRLLRRLKEQWKLSEFQMTKEELIEYGFQSGLFYI